MIITVNMKNYKFGKQANRIYKGFGMLDTETDEFISHDGFAPYVLTKKYIAQSMIDCGWAASLKTVQHS